MQATIQSQKQSTPGQEMTQSQRLPLDKETYPQILQEIYQSGTGGSQVGAVGIETRFRETDPIPDCWP